MIDPLGALVIVAAGVAAGAANAIVGAGSLITFPTLPLLGYPPLIANVSNTIGLVPACSAARSGTAASSQGSDRERGRSSSPPDWVA